jgi:hypothetical protein
MRNLVLILLALIAVITFIRAFDHSGITGGQGMSGSVVEFDVNN